VLDSTKAFDRVNYCKLFKLLVKRELLLLIIRVLANLSMNNLVRVAWGGAMPFHSSQRSQTGRCVETYSLLRVY